MYMCIIYMKSNYDYNISVAKVPKKRIWGGIIWLKSYVQNVTRIYFSRCDCGWICYPSKRIKLSISS